MTYLLHRPSGLSLEKVDSYFCKQSGPRSGPTLKGRADLHLNSVRSDDVPGRIFQKLFFYANSLNQIKPAIIMSGLVLRPRHSQIQMGGGGGRERGGPEDPFQNITKIYSFFSNWSGPLKNHKATFLCMINIRTLAKHHLDGVSLAGR